MANRLRNWIVLTLLLASAVVRASSDCDRLNARFLVTYQSQFSVAVQREVFSCDEPADKTFLVAQAIDDLHEADGKRLFYESARRLIHRTVIASAHSPACGKRVAATMGAKNTLTLCEPFFKVGRVRRAALLFHEASHGRDKDPGHVVCTQGESKGEKICDETLGETYDGSGHNWEAHFARYLFQNSPDEIVRNEARAHLSFLLDHRINGLDEAAKNAWLK